MITGDQPATAEAIAEEIGLLQGGRVVTGRELAAQDPDTLSDARVFARVSPADKLAIVRGFQQQGHSVAMLGDGINDAPAMKQADVGVAVGGRGTDVAKETADLVLQDDRLETVAVAVEEGRMIFTNIRKFVFYLFSCNLSEVGVLALAGFTSLPPPLLPLQILWLNLVTDVFPALALAVEPREEGVMEAKPRDPAAAILSRPFLWSVLGHGAVLVVAGGAAFIYVLTRGADATIASTVAFQTLALSQLAHVVNARRVGAMSFRQVFLQPLDACCRDRHPGAAVRRRKPSHADPRPGNGPLCRSALDAHRPLLPAPRRRGSSLETDTARIRGFGVKDSIRP